MYLKTQRFLILGVSKSGYAVTKYALGKGAECYIFEQLKNPKIDSSISDLLNSGAKYLTEEKVDDVLPDIDVLVISPGVPINHEIAVKCKQMGKRIIGELEFGFLQFSPTCVAITGTNGKTTTSVLTDNILSSFGLNTKLVGNIGVPITKVIEEINLDTICVAEVSSFQLESVSAFCPHISCIINIAPDHLERHYTMDNYIFLKKRIFQNQRESEFTILNYDDQTVRSFSESTKAKVKWVSIKEKVDGAYRQNGKLYFNDEFVINESDLALKGEHNVCDCLFAIAISKLLGVDNECIENALKTFKGIKHRIELVAEKEGIKFYNDSKATNTASTISAIESMQNPTVLILGGCEKGEEYYSLFQKIKTSEIKHVVITGASRFNMLEQAGKVGLTDLTVVPDFALAVKVAKMLACEGDNVLLSPACASFDNFNGYEERGEAFIKCLEEL